MKIIESHTVPQDSPGIILDRYALEVFGGRYTRKFLRKAIRRGELVVDGSKSHPLYRVGGGEILDILDNGAGQGRPFGLKLKVLYDDSFLAVVEKPPGFPVNGNRFRTIERALPGSVRSSTEASALHFPRPVHRLDASTGGALLVAKTSDSLSRLAVQFQNNEIRKTYMAVLSGRLEGGGSIISDIGGRHAETGYTALKHSRSLKNGHVTLVRLHPVTGREHQLRIHMSRKGAPIAGDGIYGEEGNTLIGKGLFLWAAGIKFTHPVNGGELSVKSELPLKFGRLMEREQRRWEKYNV